MLKFLGAIWWDVRIFFGFTGRTPLYQRPGKRCRHCKCIVNSLGFCDCDNTPC